MTDRPARARERLVVVLVVLVLGAAIVLCSTQVFSTVTPVDAKPVPVTGQGVAPALAPLGIVLLALAAALTIAGRVARVVLGLVLVLLGAVVVLLSLPNALDPAAGTRGAVSTATGVLGHVTAVAVGTAWPPTAAVAGVLAALAGAVVLVRSPGWASGGGRYRQAGDAEGRRSDPVDEWDALTSGGDPTRADEPGRGPSPTP
ncbi:Trp biosynthesis-associated membrane protein [Amnibacterium sp.]|uniref:Trp biosynthesis-associated membrane protein n=1 Tax=Amnibacterium sp. TaxID=1872496 RepID=UPI002633D983|nr:Trp biosynthesis-associated membrane protein [Amnibacterium sp.]MCU1474550.1 hypothetical protein [Amnibacterium sp.]